MAISSLQCKELHSFGCLKLLCLSSPLLSFCLSNPVSDFRSLNRLLFGACSHRQTRCSTEGKGGGEAIPYHVSIRVRDDVSREILGGHLLAEGCKLCCGIDRSHWKVLTCDRKTPRHTHRHTLLRESEAGGATSFSLGRGLGG